MPAAVVRIIGEWFPDPEVGVLRVDRGVFPECHVGNVPVLVTWGGEPPLVADNEKALRAFREVVGSEGTLVVAGPEGGDGWLRVDTTLSPPRRAAALFAAALVKVAWGWDEAGRIRIHDQVGSALIAVDFDPKEACFRVSFVASAAETVRQFFDLDAAGRWSFDRKDGVHCEGYALEVEEDRVLFGSGGPLAPDEPEWIAFDRISVEELSYFDEETRRWVDFAPVD